MVLMSVQVICLCMHVPPEVLNLTEETQHNHVQLTFMNHDLIAGDQQAAEGSSC